MKIQHVVSSIIITLMVCIAVIGGYEVYKYRQYSEWKKGIDTQSPPADRLSIPSLNSVLLWEYRPNWMYVSKDKGFSIKTNSNGFRGREFSLEKPLGVGCRIGFLGDSNVLGFFVDEKFTFVEKYEKYMNARTALSIVQAMNFGIDGYNAIQLHELLKEKVLDFELDRVIYVLNLNDFDFYDASGEKIRYYRRPKSFLLEKIGILLRNYEMGYSKGVDNFVKRHLFYFKKNKADVFNRVSSMKKILDERGIEFSVLIIPANVRATDSFSDYPLEIMHQESAMVLGGLDVDVLDLLSDFSAQDKPPSYYFHDGWHPNQFGHDFIAQRLVDRIGCSR